MVPLATLVSWTAHPPVEPLIDLVAVALAAMLMLAWRSAMKRAKSGTRDSVWAHQTPAV
ncbi:hypothetical protein SPHINGOAX6_70756 [Sphingomonas sp. AX6]|nr:hypothetical protein SPHINGOAX6_70756 [Sphingomonas sp. AX6]